MEPDRSNYEIWFIDWLDGNLSLEEAEKLRLFLVDNPDLREELEGLASINLKASENTYTGKQFLVKSPDDLSDSQFDHLCIGHLENDLTPNQETELKDIIDKDDSKKKRFELIQKLKLLPPDYSYEYKNQLKKLTLGRKLIRLSVIGLSTAAVIAIIVFAAYISLTKNRDTNGQLISDNYGPDTIYIETYSPLTKNADLQLINNSEITAVNKFKNSAIPKLPVEPAEIIESEKVSELVNTISVQEIVRAEFLPKFNVPIPEKIFKSSFITGNNLIPFEPGYLPLFEDERSNVDRFIARLFHEKIMKDTISGYRPVRTYDIAVAGITGLNKLFGWEMAFNKNTDETGEIKSYYFSSKLIKINAPVKKPENAL
jgi:hypothetical protein